MNSGKKPYDSFGRVPSHIAPSEEVRYVGTALLVGVLVWALVFLFGLVATHVVWGTGSVLETIWHGFAGVIFLISLGQVGGEHLSEFLEASVHPLALPVGMALAFVLALIAGGFAVKKLLKPRSNQRHLQGDELKTGKEAEIYAKLHSSVLPGPFDIQLGPLRIPKEQANKGFLFSGGVGSGKTVCMTDVYEQVLLAVGSKSLLYDVKGDYTARFNGPTIISPFDARSAIWDMAHDLRTQTQISNMAQAFFPDTGGKDKFFVEAGRGIFMSALLHVYHRFGTSWTILDLEDAVNRTASEHLESAQLHDPKTAMLISDPESQTTASILATVASGTRVLSSMARAWGDPYLIGKDGKHVLDKHGNKKLRARFSLMEWMKDDSDPTKDWSRAPRHVILQGGPDKALTRAYINAMLNVLTPEMISVAFPDNQHGRHIGIFLDEMPSLGKLDLGGLLDQGRSKGIVNVWAYQDMAQLEEVYGPNLPKAMASMVGTKVMCQIGSGHTRKILAESFGAKQVVQVAHKDGAVAQEVGKAVVYEDVLTNALGKYTGPIDKATGKATWGIKAIVHTVGLNPMLLKIPGKTFENKRRPLVRAHWTTTVPMAKTNAGDTLVEKQSLFDEMTKLQEGVDAVRQQHKARARYLEEKQDYYKDMRAMRYSAREMGLDEDEVFNLLEELRPKFVPPVPRSSKLTTQGFIRS